MTLAESLISSFILVGLATQTGKLLVIPCKPSAKADSGMGSMQPSTAILKMFAKLFPPGKRMAR